ncbi:FKBP-type peptidyl-prolyl cis-trans isomerase [Flavobacterium sp. IMCC34518]|uniref:FKBP-type peptidyl-prolyl cis-trans isomerase n=1 Tax=Flavobacterium sp. IMCC34518 TaxID=3003623 RepID=UPI0024821635|nr:FKBP-type peptidyl-prolyl cis-trans isomerase [Flavobacterium sp. IMCC34518]
MSKIKFYFIFLIATVISISSCNKDDNNTVATPPKPYAEQYNLDIVAIEDYLKTNYISEVVNHPGFPDDQDVTIKKITDAAIQPSLYSYLNSPTLPRLTSRNVSLHSITYKVYTLVIREGVKGGTPVSGGEYPCNVDGVFAGYKGTLLDGTVFDSSNNGQTLFNLDGTSHDGGSGVIRGWSEGFPQFKTGWLTSNTNGTVSYNDFGVGVMILPSGLGYYNSSQTKIPAYSPLVFSIKLYALKRYDHDLDGIPSFQEDLNGDRYMNSFATGVPNPDDTDEDGIPNFIDFDDDGDGYATRGEIKDINGKYYPFESIPDCSGKIPNDPKKKRHLDKECHFMNQ